MDSDRLIPLDQEVTELFFPRRTQHDAYVMLREILQRAQTSITVIDPYLDGSIFTMLATVSSNAVTVHLLTYNTPSDFPREARKFLSQYGNFTLEIRLTAEFHDRFIILDANECWHVGCSLKDAGNKAFMLSKMEDTANRDAFIRQHEASWLAATNVVV